MSEGAEQVKHITFSIKKINNWELESEEKRRNKKEIRRKAIAIAIVRTLI